MSITVHQSDCKVTVVIACKDSHEAELVAAELAADVNSGEFKPDAMAWHTPEDEPVVKKSRKKAK